jgi:uncharacterized protein
MEFISQTWHWSISGFIIGMVMLSLIYFGKHFGMSTNLRTLCSMAGAGKYAAFFDWDWKSQKWNLVLVLGAMLGGFVATHYLHDDSNVTLNPKTIIALKNIGISEPKGNIEPDFMFGDHVFKSPKMIFVLLFGGLLIGFGSRYAGGCTSGHAITGLSNLQGQSLKAVIGFFVGGLIMSYFLFPLLF